MQKVVLVLLILSGCSHPSHLQSLKEAYPNGLIGDDFGVLTVDDLAVNTCNVFGENAYPPEGASPYRYWQCFIAKNVFISCEEEDQDKDSTVIMGMYAAGKTRLQVYVSRQVMPLKRCIGFQKDLKNLIEKENYICISGEFIEDSESSHETAWVFDKFKTKRGCVSYWDECDLKEQIVKGCKPRPPRGQKTS